MNGLRMIVATVAMAFGLAMAAEGTSQADGLVLKTFAFRSRAEVREAGGRAYKFLRACEQPAHLAGPYYDRPHSSDSSGYWQVVMNVPAEVTSTRVVVVQPAYTRPVMVLGPTWRHPHFVPRELTTRSTTLGGTRRTQEDGFTARRVPTSGGNVHRRRAPAVGR